MKKLSVILALVLCLVLTVFAFASCDKKDKKDTDATTAKPATTAEPATTAAPATTTAEIDTLAPHVHVAGDYEVDFPPTCVSEGEQSQYCVECDALIEGSTVKIPVDPNAHVIDEWVEDDVSLLNPTGKKTGHCTACNRDIVKDIAYEPVIWNANNKTSAISATIF